MFFLFVESPTPQKNVQEPWASNEYGVHLQSLG